MRTEFVNGVELLRHLRVGGLAQRRHAVLVHVFCQLAIWGPP